ncbi:MAG: class I SAM-dependent methyltransferase [Opitutaceae bacterium]|jgi:ubiquinone/menaquinone biosynthesis C-methylase UbiE
MNADEYTNLEQVERSHWYYSGKRELVRYWLKRCGPLRPDQKLLDCGAGTGIFAQEISGLCQVSVLDDHEESIRLLRARFPEDRILRVSGAPIPVADASFDYLTALDVLEHIEQDRMAVKEFARIVKPGGHVVITVPASMALWSDWDVALHHHRRYDKAGLRSIFGAEQWSIEAVNYTNIAAFPAVWAIRHWRCLWARIRRTNTRLEDVTIPAWVNWVLRRLFVEFGKVSALPFPFGVSLILVARRR